MKTTTRSALDRGRTERIDDKERQRRSISRPEALPRGGEPPAHWTFLTNHSHVLILLCRDPQMILREVALRVGITERAVQRIITELEQAGYLERARVGRRNQYRVLENKPLRHPIESHRLIADLLELLCPVANPAGAKVNIRGS